MMTVKLYLSYISVNYNKDNTYENTLVTTHTIIIYLSFSSLEITLLSVHITM